MTENPDARPEPLYLVEHEGEMVRAHRAILPRQVLEMEAGYQRGTHLVIQIEARVRSMGYPEQTSGKQKGELVREHALAIESVALVDTMTSAQATPAVGGSASADEQTRVLEVKEYGSEPLACYYDPEETQVVHRGGCDLCALPPEHWVVVSAEPSSEIPPDIQEAIDRAAAIEAGLVDTSVGF